MAEDALADARPGRIGSVKTSASRKRFRISVAMWSIEWPPCPPSPCPCGSCARPTPASSWACSGSPGSCSGSQRQPGVLTLRIRTRGARPRGGARATRSPSSRSGPWLSGHRVCLDREDAAMPPECRLDDCLLARPELAPDVQHDAGSHRAVRVNRRCAGSLRLGRHRFSGGRERRVSDRPNHSAAGNALGPLRTRAGSDWSRSRASLRRTPSDTAFSRSTFIPHTGSVAPRRAVSQNRAAKMAMPSTLSASL